MTSFPTVIHSSTPSANAAAADRGDVRNIDSSASSLLAFSSSSPSPPFLSARILSRSALSCSRVRSIPSIVRPPTLPATGAARSTPALLSVRPFRPTCIPTPATLDEM